MTTPQVDKSFGPRLTKLREARRLSQKELAARVGCQPGLISKLEGGSKEPRWLWFYLNLSVALDVPVGEVLGASENRDAIADPGLAVRVRTLCERIAPDQVPALFALLDAALGLAAGTAGTVGETP